MNSAFNFDIDIDLTPILGPAQCANDMLLNSRWYEMAHPQSSRSQELQQKLDRALDDALRSVAKRSFKRNSLDRRSCQRIALDLLVNVNGAPPLQLKNLSTAGLACVGHPTAPVIDIEFTLPTMTIPIESRAEVVRYNDGDTTSEVGLRFVQLDKPYREFILTYIAEQQATL